MGTLLNLMGTTFRGYGLLRCCFGLTPTWVAAPNHTSYPGLRSGGEIQSLLPMTITVTITTEGTNSHDQDPTFYGKVYRPLLSLAY